MENFEINISTYFNNGIYKHFIIFIDDVAKIEEKVISNSHRLRGDDIEGAAETFSLETGIDFNKLVEAINKEIRVIAARDDL